MTIIAWLQRWKRLKKKKRLITTSYFLKTFLNIPQYCATTIWPNIYWSRFIYSLLINLKTVLAKSTSSESVNLVPIILYCCIINLSDVIKALIRAAHLHAGIAEGRSKSYTTPKQWSKQLVWLAYDMLWRLPWVVCHYISTILRIIRH